MALDHRSYFLNSGCFAIDIFSFLVVLILRKQGLQVPNDLREALWLASD